MRTEHQRARDRRRRSRYYLDHKVRGICVRCTAVAESDCIFCARHREAKRAENSRRRAASSGA